MFEYRLMPMPAASKKAKGLKTISERFAHAMTEALNTESLNGWDFVRQEAFSVEEKTGLRKKTSLTEVSFLIFRREIAQDAVPLDQKLELLRNKRERTMIQAAVATAPAATLMPEKNQLTGTEESAGFMPEPVAEPFPEPMPAYVPEQVVEPPKEASQSGVLPYPGGAPEQTIGETGSEKTPDKDGPTPNYDHSKSGNGASVDAPILGPARRD